MIIGLSHRPHHLHDGARGFVVLIAMMLVSFGSVPPGYAQNEVPHLALQEALFEEGFAAALEMSDSTEPIYVLQAWGSVLMSATLLERTRKKARGESWAAGDNQAVTEGVLQRWLLLRPESGGPALFRALQIQDAALKRAAVIALVDRYPDDLAVVWQATTTLQHAGEVGRAADLAESWVSRNPDQPMGYRMLFQVARENKTRRAEILERWAQATPGDSALVTSWLASNLPQRDPQATRQVLTEFFTRRPTDNTGLTACLRVMRNGDPSFAEDARACVARIAVDPEVPSRVSERATSGIAETAAADGDWPALMDVLDILDPQTRVRTLIAAADGLDTPERCGEKIELLSVAAESLAQDDGHYRSVAAGLRGCSDRTAAQTMYMTLLRQAPADQALRVIHSWVSKVNGVYRGELPADAADLLEKRLRAEPDAADLFRALDIAYQLFDLKDRRFDLLRRWHRQAPASFRGEQAIQLAGELMWRENPDAAIELLEQQLESRFEPDVAEELWGLYLQVVGPGEAEGFAATLTGSTVPWREQTGHTLAGRSAALRGDLATAESHYWKALEGDYPRQDVAVELLAAVAWHGDASAAGAMARRLCEETKLAKNPQKVPQCATDLLTRAGRGEAAAIFLAAQSADLPEDPETLRKLASTAQTAGQSEVAERALRRILEIDPRNEAGWTGLGGFFEKQGRVTELEDLLERSRELFSPPPSYLARAAGRALTAAGQPRRAIDVLLQARATLPDTSGGEWSRSWINHELRQGYRRLGELEPLPRTSAAPAPIRSIVAEPPALPEGGSATELRLTADAFQSGAGGLYNPDAAAELYARAAAMGDPLGTFRLAILRKLGRANSSADATTPCQLYRRSVQAVEALAQEGDGYAQYLVGTAALIGLGGREDHVAARRWLEPAAAQGEIWALHNLAWMEETGRGFKSADPAAALASYRRASEAGNALSMLDFARLAINFYGSGALCAEGLRWLERSSTTGNAQAAAFLGKLLLYGRDECVPANPRASLEWLEASVSTHQPGAAYDLAIALLTSGDDKASQSRGVALLEQAARSPSALAVETLAFLHATGIAVPRDPETARRFRTDAARLGSDGFARLSQEARISKAYAEFLDRGIQRLRTLAERDDPVAMAFLTRLYTAGLVSEIEPERIAQLAHQAAAGWLLYYGYR